MTNPTPKRFRPRFSVRTLVIVVTLVRCYAACWGPTKRRGVDDVGEHVRPTPVYSSGTMSILYFQQTGLWPNSSAVAPLIVGINTWQAPGQRKYYFWFFGYVAKLPWEREIEQPAVRVL